MTKQKGRIRVLVTVSGGLDSAVAAHLAVRDYGHDNVGLVYVDTGTVHAHKAEVVVRHLKTNLGCEFFALRAEVPSQIRDRYYLFNKALYEAEVKRRKQGVADMCISDDRFLELYVPGLYMMIWNLVGALGASELYDLIWTGHHKQPKDLLERVTSDLMDTSISFLNVLNEMRDVLWGPNAPLFDLPPLATLYKEEVMGLARELGVDIEATNSCDLWPPCGVCFECQLRERALKK